MLQLQLEISGLNLYQPMHQPIYRPMGMFNYDEGRRDTRTYRAKNVFHTGYENNFRNLGMQMSTGNFNRDEDMRVTRRFQPKSNSENNNLVQAIMNNPSLSKLFTTTPTPMPTTTLSVVHSTTTLPIRRSFISVSGDGEKATKKIVKSQNNGVHIQTQNAESKNENLQPDKKDASNRDISADIEKHGVKKRRTYCEAQARVWQGSARDGPQGERPQSLTPCLELTLKLD